MNRRRWLGSTLIISTALLPFCMMFFQADDGWKMVQGSHPMKWQKEIASLIIWVDRARWILLRDGRVQEVIFRIVIVSSDI